jgi:dolichyl-diphosphooligosaccharide--protein glycosyltransferase
LIATSAESNFLPLPSFRYLNAINPFLTTTNPLVDSVSEHATTTISQSFFLHSVLMIFSGLGVWLILNKKMNHVKIIVKNDMKAFVLIMGITGVYVSSAFIRLEVFASISLIILSSISLSYLTTEIFKAKLVQNRNYMLKISYIAIIAVLFIIPITFPLNGNWISAVDIPPTILNGGTVYPAGNDWPETLEWIKMNTPHDAVIASWWDYGYWITTMSERTTLADNATIDSKQIKNIAKIFLNSPDESWNMLREMNVDYVVVFVAAQNLDVDYEGKPLYVMGGGGDESKKQWFMRIAEVPLSKYLHSDGMSGTDYFWNETLLGKMIPFTTLAYHNFQNQQQSGTFKPGSSEISIKDIKYHSDNDPLKLVYASSSFINENNLPVTGVFVYEINKNYVPIIS